MKRLVVLGILFSAGALSISAAAWQAPAGGGQPAPRVVTAEKLRDNLIEVRVQFPRSRGADVPARVLR